ncbi:MAG TPA: hypothetical protein DEP29_03505 [Bifidobacterium sp.]|nr:hypothetical protein [Bifidobacterium sp.]
MSWMDDGGFEIKAFTSKDGTPMARMNFRTSTGQYGITLSKTDVQRIRRECAMVLKEINQKKEQQ